MDDRRQLVTGLRADLRLARGRFCLDVAMTVEPGQVVALLGPNGAGKSTVLSCLAGLSPVQQGSVVLGGRVLDDPATGVFVPPRARRVGMVFQDYLLFPHLSAADNVAFGLRAGGVARRRSRELALAALERVGLAEFPDVRPSRLSGGQAQRVALARALAPGPDLLLLDEPLAALDAGTRMQVRSDLRRHLAGYAGCTVLVTHHPLDALVLADRLIVVENGRIVQEGTPAEVARAPRTDYAARLVGLNLHRGTARGSAVEVDGGGSLITSAVGAGGGSVDGPAGGGGDGPVFLAFSPSAVSLHREEPSGSARNRWPGRVAGLEQRGDTVRVQVSAHPPVLADVTVAAIAALDLTLGAPVWAAVKATEIARYPA